MDFLPKMLWSVMYLKHQFDFCHKLVLQDWIKYFFSVIFIFAVSLQPVNPRQAMVKRLSVVNLENFKRQYARRRWKVKFRNESSIWLIWFNWAQTNLLAHIPCFILSYSFQSELYLCATTLLGSWRRTKRCV